MNRPLAILLTLAAIAVSATAATDYGITVNGTKITSDKLSITAGSGTVSYVPSSCTLTFSNATISLSGEALKVLASNNRSARLNLVFNGTCLLTSTGSDAVLLEEGADFIINSVTVIQATGGGKYAVHIKNDEDADFDGSGSLLLQADDGYALGGVSGGNEWAYFKIYACTLQGKRGNLINLGRVQVQPVSTSVERSTAITLEPTKSSNYAHAQNVGNWILKDNVHVEAPIGLTTTSIASTSNYSKQFVISDERDNPSLTTIGNFQYSTAYYDSYPVASLVKPTVAFKQSQPTSVEVPGFVTLGGALRPVYVNSASLKSLTNAHSVSFKYGVVAIGSNALYGCGLLTRVDLPSSIQQIGEYAFFHDVTGVQSTQVYWATIDPSKTTLAAKSLSATPHLHIYLHTLNAVEKAQATAYINDISYVESTPSLNAYDIYDNGYFYVASKGILSNDEGEIALVGSSSGTIFVNAPSASRTFVMGGKTYHCTSVAPTAYQGKTTITGANFTGSGITEIGERAFLNCSGMTSLTLGSATTTIGMAAFMGTSITTVTIPQAVKTVGAYAFSTTSLTSVTWNATNADDISTSSARPFDGCSNLKTFTVGLDVERFPANLCTGITSLTTVN